MAYFSPIRIPIHNDLTNFLVSYFQLPDYLSSFLYLAFSCENATASFLSLLLAKRQIVEGNFSIYVFQKKSRQMIHFFTWKMCTYSKFFLKACQACVRWVSKSKPETEILKFLTRFSVKKKWVTHLFLFEIWDERSRRIIKSR